MEDAVVEVSIATGVAPADVADMDILSFSALFEVIERVSARRKYESAWTAMVSAQGTKESMEKLTKPWKQNVEPAKNANDLLRDLQMVGMKKGKL